MLKSCILKIIFQKITITWPSCLDIHWSDLGNLPSMEVKNEVSFCFRISKYLAKVWRTFLLVLSLEGKAVLLSFLFFSTFYFNVNTFYSSFHPSSLRVWIKICKTSITVYLPWRKRGLFFFESQGKWWHLNSCWVFF